METMTAYDTALNDLAARIRRLSARALAGLFWACSTALLPEAVAWAEHWGQQPGPALAEGLAAAYQFAAAGARPPGPRQLLRRLEASAPFGESPDYYSPGNAQDCWICAAVSIRVLADPGYDPGRAIQYALEPVMAMATQELFGVSQVGSGDQEEAQVIAIMSHPLAAGAIRFCQQASDFLRKRPSPAEDDLAELARTATALTP
jgi:hypothetical protein